MGKKSSSMTWLISCHPAEGPGARPLLPLQGTIPWEVSGDWNRHQHVEDICCLKKSCQKKDENPENQSVMSHKWSWISDFIAEKLFRTLQCWFAWVMMWQGCDGPCDAYGPWAYERPTCDVSPHVAGEKKPVNFFMQIQRRRQKLLLWRPHLASSFAAKCSSRFLEGSVSNGLKWHLLHIVLRMLLSCLISTSVSEFVVFDQEVRMRDTCAMIHVVLWCRTRLGTA